MEEKLLDDIINKYCTDNYIDLISYYADRPDPVKIPIEQFIAESNNIKRLAKNIYFFHIEDIRGDCFIITADDISVFVIHNYSGYLENDEVIRLYSYLPESYCEAYGEYVVNKADMTVDIKPFVSYNNFRANYTDPMNEYNFSVEEADDVDDIDIPGKYKMTKELSLYRNASKREKILSHKNSK